MQYRNFLEDPLITLHGLLLLKRAVFGHDATSLLAIGPPSPCPEVRMGTDLGGWQVQVQA